MTPNTPFKSLSKTSDDKLLASWKLPSNWEGEIYLNETRDKIMQDTTYEKGQYFDATKLVTHHGLREDNFFHKEMETERKKTYAMYKQRATDPSSGVQITKIGDVVLTETIFELPFRVKQEIYNPQGAAVNSVSADMLQSGDEWASMVLHKEPTEVVNTRPRVRRRGVRPNGGAGTTRPRDASTQHDQHTSNTRRPAAPGGSPDVNMYDANGNDPRMNPIPSE